MKHLLAIIVGLLFVAVASASDCGRRRPHDYGYATPVLIADPTYYLGHVGYSVGYSRDDSELLKTIFEAYKKEADDHKATLKRQIAAGGDPTKLKAAFAPRHPGLGVLNARCASCHSDTTKGAGKGFSFLTDTGDFIQGSKGDNIDKVLERIDYEHGGDMPKGGKLTDSESLQVERFGRTLPPPTEATAAKAGMPPAK
jgi:mono/diheme cytochrome c family protein